MTDGPNYDVPKLLSDCVHYCDVRAHDSHSSKTCSVRGLFKALSTETIRVTSFGARLSYTLSFVLGLSAYWVDVWGKATGHLIPLETWVLGIILAPFGCGFIVQVADKLKIEVRKSE